jgi:2'-5' RNA ligase
MLPSDRLVCAFVEDQEIDTQFQKWLLHVTIVPWFRLPDSSEDIAQGLVRALKMMVPFEFVMGETAMFGPHHDRPAMLVQEPTPLASIEKQVRNYLHKKRAWLVDETTKRRYEFRPHVTTQDKLVLQAGEAFQCDRLYIVEQKGDYKEIVSEVHLGK